MIFRKCFVQDSKVIVAVDAKTKEEADELIYEYFSKPDSESMSLKFDENARENSFWIQSYENFKAYKDSDIYTHDDFVLFGEPKKKSVFHIQMQDDNETVLLYKRCTSFPEVFQQIHKCLRMFDVSSKSKAVVRNITVKDINGTLFWTIPVTFYPNGKIDEEKGTN